jgi:hypothetical protein
VHLVFTLCVFVVCVLWCGVFVGLGICCTLSIDVFPLNAGLLARGQYSEGPATGHLVTGFSWFPRVFNPLPTNVENMVSY